AATVLVLLPIAGELAVEQVPGEPVIVVADDPVRALGVPPAQLAELREGRGIGTPPDRRDGGADLRVHGGLVGLPWGCRWGCHAAPPAPRMRPVEAGPREARRDPQARRPAPGGLGGELLPLGLVAVPRLLAEPLPLRPLVLVVRGEHLRQRTLADVPRHHPAV